ncbi:DUF4157 domain-containing protein [Streptomyces sp. DT193]|uniref:eCIS core domain-containing protein n=1 Tax=Streptomyces sp. DT193 TaxID=3393418 RepID=UPI003CF00012
MPARDTAKAADGRERNTDRSPARTPVAAPSAASGGAMSFLALQRTVGNAAVLQLLRQSGHPWTQEQHQHGAGCGHQHAEQPAVQRSAVHDVLRTGGRPLDDSTRTDMEARLGADFSDVRLHTDAAARASAAEIGARAYTSGSHVVIGDGGGDRHTLAHELTHVIQQRQGPVAGTDNGSGLRVSEPSDRFEREAESNARRVLGGSPAGLEPQGGGQARTVGAAQAPSVQRAIGLEIEIDRPVVNHDGSDVRHGNSSGQMMMEHERQGIKLVSDLRKSPEGGLYSNAELVSKPSAVLPGEADRLPPVEETLNHLEEAHRRLYQPQSESPDSEKKMQKLFPKKEGYGPGQPGYKLARVAPEKAHDERNGQPGKGQGLFVHQTVGVPLHGMAGFFAQALNEAEPENQARGGRKIRTDRHDSHKHLAQSIQFGTRLAADFRTRHPQAQQDTEEIRGFGALMYTQLAALTDKRRADHGAGQVKNKTAVLSRVGLGTAVQTLSAEARLYLSTNTHQIMGLFFEEYLQVHPWASGTDLAGNVAADEAQVLQNYAHSALTGGDARQDDPTAFGGMTQLNSPDLVQGVPVFPVELRTFGPNLTSFDNLRQDVRLLSQWSNDALTGAVNARNGVHAPFGLIEATAPGAAQAQPYPDVVRGAYEEAMKVFHTSPQSADLLRPLVQLLQITYAMAERPVPDGRDAAAWGNSFSQGARLLLDTVQAGAQNGPIDTTAVRTFAQQLAIEAPAVGKPQLVQQIGFLLSRQLKA